MSLLPAIVENLAQRLAARQNGWVAPAQLLPYLPVSLEMAEAALDAMVDRETVFSQERNGWRGYEFPELIDGQARDDLGVTGLLSGEPLAGTDGHDVLSPETWQRLDAELRARADHDAWPAEAVWQHELLYVTAETRGPVKVAAVAGHSRLTLRQVKERLLRLAKDGHCSLEEHDGHYRYRFPPMDYPRSAFKRHDAAIRAYPAALRDEWEIKAMKILMVWIIAVFACLGVAFGLRLPFPLLLFAGLLSGAFFTWRVASAKNAIEPSPLR